MYYLHIMEKRFKKYLNGTCNPEEFSGVLELLSAKTADSEIPQLMFQLWNEPVIGENGNKENRQLLDKIHYRIEKEESKVIARRILLYKNLLKIAAVLVIGLVTSVLALYNRPINISVSSIKEKVTVPYGARTNFKLPDGSSVWLNSGSVISYPNHFGNVREVELSGQAYFEVITNQTPFVVSTGTGKVEVMGTSFDVKAYPGEDFETTLVEGIVKVMGRSNNSTTLEPGQQSVLTSADQLSVNEINTLLITSWKEGKLTFEKEPFQNVARELERWYNVNIELKGEKLKQLCFTGTIEMETFSEVLELIKTTVPIEYVFDKKTRVLRIFGK